jgi:hypothetical protein
MISEVSCEVEGKFLRVSIGLNAKAVRPLTIQTGILEPDGRIAQSTRYILSQEEVASLTQVIETYNLQQSQEK